MQITRENLLTLKVGDSIYVPFFNKTSIVGSSNNFEVSVRRYSVTRFYEDKIYASGVYFIVDDVFTIYTTLEEAQEHIYKELCKTLQTTTQCLLTSNYLARRLNENKVS